MDPRRSHLFGDDPAMKIDLLRQYLDEPNAAKPWLDQSLRLRETATGHGNLRRMAEAGVTLDLLADLCEQFAEAAPTLADADMAWNNLERFVVATRNPLGTCALFERDRQALPRLLAILSTSQYLSDLLVVDNEAYDLLRMTEGQPVARDLLVEELVGEILSVTQPAEAMRILRHFKRRETMRIAYGDIVREQPIPTVARQISFVADAAVEAAVRFARRRWSRNLASPSSMGDRPSTWCSRWASWAGSNSITPATSTCCSYPKGMARPTAAGKRVIKNSSSDSPAMW